MEANRESLLVEIPRELAEQVERLVERMAQTPLARYAQIDREVALRIALARGIEALGEDERTALE
jgi:hypothetical protein